MALFGFVLGSVFGLFCAGVAWLGLGVAFITAFGIYLGCGIAGGLLTLASSARPTPGTPMAQAIRV